MDPPAADDDDLRCSCACPCCSSPSSSTTSSLPRSKKRKLGQMTDDDAATAADGGGSGEGDVGAVARVEIENEVAALREAVTSQQQTIQDLCAELDEERSASATAASETMSMILRLQHEKAEVQMEARNFKRFAEEKMAHDQEELAALDELLFKREEALQSLSFQVQAYRHRLLSYGIGPDHNIAEVAEAAADFEYYYEPRTPQFNGDLPQTLQDNGDVPVYDYPPLKCTIPDCYDEDEQVDHLEKYAFGETPRGKEDPVSPGKIAATPGSSHVMEKGVIGQSPKSSSNMQKSSTDNYGLGSGKNSREFKKVEEFPVTVDRPLDDNEEADDTSDRVYTIDMVYGAPTATVSHGYNDEPREKDRIGEIGGEMDQGENVDIKKLYMRLQSLEADRETMRQAIVSMRTEKAQLVLLKEMAQQLRNEVVPHAKVVKKKSLAAGVSLVIIPVFKWIMSFVLWKKRASRSKYTFGLSSSNVGLLLLLDKSPELTYWRYLSRNSMVTATTGRIAPSCSRS